MGLRGMVILRVQVDAEGNYVTHRVLQSSHAYLTQLCEQQLSRLKFSPAQQNGRNVKAWVTVPFTFNENM
jgi:protein TonB